VRTATKTTGAAAAARRCLGNGGQVWYPIAVDLDSSGTESAFDSDPAPGSTPAASSRARAGVLGGLPVLGVALWVWLTGAVVSVLLLGPGLGPGSLLNLDLVTVPDLPVPHGVWGLGPELPRRVPLWLLLSWLSQVIGGDAAVKVLIVVGLTVAFVGMYRLVDRPGLASLGAAALYTFGPFLLTRVAVGHLMVLWTMALLPWALPDLLAPDRSLRRDLWWAAVIGVAGIYGGMICGFVLTAGLIARRGRRLVPVVTVFLVGQLPWLIPMLVVGWAGSIVDGSAFVTDSRGFQGVGRLLAGQGFWNGYFQIGKGQGWLAAAAGLVLLALAAYGTRELPKPWRAPLVGLAVAGLLIALLVAVPGPDRLTARFTATMVGAPMREAQRFLLLYLLWMAPAAALGAARLARLTRGATAGMAAAIPLIIAIGLASPAWWGFDGQLRPAAFPPEWAQARHLIESDPGTVVAFPWYQYFTLDLADNRLVLNVVPFYFGGDVIISSDPNVTTAPKKERRDQREDEVARLARGATDGIPVSTAMAAMGVHWVVLQRDVNWLDYTGVTEDPGFELMVSGQTLNLYRVRDWAGVVSTLDGTPVASDPVVTPYRRLDASGEARFAAPYESGWLRGWSSTAENAQGLIALPGGSGPLWYWPAVLVLLGDLATVSALVGVEVRHRRHGPISSKSA
jgi:hypothetical protein